MSENRDFPGPGGKEKTQDNEGSADISLLEKLFIPLAKFPISSILYPSTVGAVLFYT